MPRERPFFQYVIGSFVRLASDAPVHRVIWRGKLPMPAYSDWIGDIAVYRLDNDYWDCYYEYQLHPARPWEKDATS